jgi:hypothetical protein
VLLKLEHIRVNGGTQPRVQLLIEVMEDYAEQMRSGAEFPPITVFFDGKDYWLPNARGVKGRGGSSTATDTGRRARIANRALRAPLAGPWTRSATRGN